jgi:hypothetical protein
MSLIESHTPKITVTAGCIKSSQFVMSSPAFAWWCIPTILSASVLIFLLAGNSLTSNSLLQMSCLHHIDTDRTENTVAMQTCLFAEPLLSNSCCVVACLATGLHTTMLKQRYMYIADTVWVNGDVPSPFHELPILIKVPLPMLIKLDMPLQ